MYFRYLNRLLVILFFASIHGYTQDNTLTFKFDNVTSAGGVVSFDVMVAAGEPNRRFGDAQIYINYNSQAIGINVADRATVIKGDLIDGAVGSPATAVYNIVNVANNRSDRLAITINFISDETDNYYPDLAEIVPDTDPGSQIVSVQLPVENGSVPVDLSFEETLMDEQCYMSDVTPYEDVVATDFYTEPILVNLVSFTARETREGICLEWETASESNCAGFHLLRRAEKNRDYGRVNKMLIVSKTGAGTGGAQYSYVDRPDRAGVYDYRLEQIGLDGSAIRGVSVSVELITEVAGILNKPDAFDLKQNYPNPFNPVTHIDYQVPKSCFVELSIYNLKGQLIDVLVQGERKAGYYSELWNARDYSNVAVGNGIYIVRMRAGDFVRTHKLTVLK